MSAPTGRPYFETYRGVRIKITRGRQWGYVRIYINGVDQGERLGMDKARAAESERGYIDMAGERPGAFADYYTPKDDR